MEIRAFERGDLDQTIRLCRAEGWESYCADPERTYRALSASNVICLVAVENEKVWEFAQCLTDGAIRAYLASMVVEADKRGTAIGKRLVEEILASLQRRVCRPALDRRGPRIHESFPHQKFVGYRIYPKSAAR
jgi:GNAT superfamily N-acetyltransferase